MYSSLRKGERERERIFSLNHILLYFTISASSHLHFYHFSKITAEYLSSSVEALASSDYRLIRCNNKISMRKCVFCSSTRITRRIHENTMKIILNFSSSMRDASKVSFQVLTIQSRGEKWRNTNDVARYLRARSRKTRVY